jgi:3-hydroxybenzoate 6-monooxygenase
MNALVVGGGISGITAALVLIRCGLEVQIFEQADELNEIDAGIQIGSNGTKVFE